MPRLLFPPKFRAFDSSGNPLAGGKLYTYASGTTTPLATYSDSAGLTPNANPVVLDANGEATIFVGTAQYKLVLKDSSDVTQWTIDPYNGNLTAATDGIDGRTINYGSGAPSSGTGNDGDFYLRTSNYDFYGPKASGAWPSPVSLTGQATLAAASEAAAAASATAAAASETAAASSASSASTSATNAANSASAAATSATSASGSATTATAQASAASTSATNAATSATNAANSATAAAASATAAATFDPALYAKLGGVSGGQTLKGGTASGDDLTLQSTAHATKGTITAGIIEVDEANSRVGIGMAGSAPTHRLHFRAGADDYAHGFALDHVSGGANSLWRFYPDLNSTISLYNPNQATTVFSMIATEQQLRLNEGGSDGGAVNIRNATGKTSHHTLVLKKLASQTGDAIRVYDSDGSTVLAKVDIAGGATFSSLALGTDLPITEGGTGASSASAARTNLGVAIGTDVLAYVAPGTSGNVLTSNGSAWTSAAPSGGSTIRDYVIVDGGNGHGSTNTKIRRFSNNRASAGTTITYADSATNGGSFTVGSDGIYAISYCDVYGTGNESFGITVNDSAMTTNISNPLTYAQGMRIIARGEPNGGAVALSWTGFLSNGDVVRAHTNGNANATGANCMFTIIKIAN